ncbi:hypothetical protein [Streptomyces sp. T12]|uniref:hypothetical protein n=1 Tax=Streptomyces sp. T12 TaxID=477697 RepID=UPI0016463D70|nr:hypothetical protein [Streptomyces sp. T12]
MDRLVVALRHHVRTEPRTRSLARRPGAVGPHAGQQDDDARSAAAVVRSATADLRRVTYSRIRRVGWMCSHES